LPVVQDSASAADAMLAANMRSRQTDIVPQEITQECTRLDLALEEFPIDRQAYSVQLVQHVMLPCRVRLQSFRI
jgi:hypothetical protein